MTRADHHDEITRTEQRAKVERIARASARFAQTPPEHLVDLAMAALGTLVFEEALDQLVAAVRRCEDTLPAEVAAAWSFMKVSTIRAIAETSHDAKAN